MLIVTDCCCGCSLRTGTLIIGWVALALNLIQFIIVGVTAQILLDTEPKDTEIYGLYKEVLIISLVIGVILLSATVLLVIGSLTGRAWCLVVWVVVYRIYVVLSAILFLHSIRSASNYTRGGTDVLVQGGITIVLGAVVLYSSMVVYSYSRAMKSETNQSTLPPYSNL